MKSYLLPISLMLGLALSLQTASGQVLSNKNHMNFKTIKIYSVEIFYREAGDPAKPTILLLHGFPSSSHMYRDLISDLSDKYHVIAPDYPGFGQSSAPPVKEYDYTFDNLSKTIEQFIDALKLEKFSLYMQDYGGPVGLRIALRRPELINALIIQNANSYLQGLGDLKPFLDYIKEPNQQNEESVRQFFTLSATKWQYTEGAGDVFKISPDSYTIDQYYLDRPGNDAVQLALCRDYGSNFPKYKEWQAYFRKYKPKTLIVWGKNDKLFTSTGAKAYLKDLPNAELHLLNGGHFLLEEYHLEVSKIIDKFLAGNK